MMLLTHNACEPRRCGPSLAAAGPGARCLRARPLAAPHHLRRSPRSGGGCLLAAAAAGPGGPGSGGDAAERGESGSGGSLRNWLQTEGQSPLYDLLPRGNELDGPEGFGGYEPHNSAEPCGEDWPRPPIALNPPPPAAEWSAPEPRVRAGPEPIPCSVAAISAQDIGGSSGAGDDWSDRAVEAATPPGSLTHNSSTFVAGRNDRTDPPRGGGTGSGDSGTGSGMGLGTGMAAGGREAGAELDDIFEEAADWVGAVPALGTILTSRAAESLAALGGAASAATHRVTGAAADVAERAAAEARSVATALEGGGSADAATHPDVAARVEVAPFSRAPVRKGKTDLSVAERTVIRAAGVLEAAEAGMIGAAGSVTGVVGGAARRVAERASGAARVVGRKVSAARKAAGGAYLVYRAAESADLNAEAATEAAVHAQVAAAAAVADVADSIARGSEAAAEAVAAGPRTVAEAVSGTPQAVTELTEAALDGAATAAAKSAYVGIAAGGKAVEAVGAVAEAARDSVAAAAERVREKAVVAEQAAEAQLAAAADVLAREHGSGEGKGRDEAGQGQHRG
ncbi:hypothetical protein HYH03_000169 [Edaphochlamys debaryana]|uniref:Senescence domain-containing protein n=1 Tax=Edaphochlamys debaryana TaxID=47281 RepID=A0A835YIQ4_9CHLO|nr:hypothetical protein HYH03_000169 [Edaphochlamys debaryana]|eukprot:KAG2501666.1 hypothetical protein HYH03_000169 [Edaphochlamys debaryana]